MDEIGYFVLTFLFVLIAPLTILAWGWVLFFDDVMKFVERRLKGKTND